MKPTVKDKIVICFMVVLSYGIGFMPILIPPFSIIYVIIQILLWYFIAMICVKRNICCNYLCYYRFIITLVGFVYFMFDVNALENQENMFLLLITQIFPVFDSYLGVYLAGSMMLTIFPLFIINFLYDTIIVVVFYLSKKKHQSKGIDNAENKKF